MTSDGLPWGDQPYSIVRHGTSIAACATEPVRTPGCIQAHGGLLVARPDDLVVVQASERIDIHLGRSTAEILGQPIAHALGDAVAREIVAHLADAQPDANPLRVTTTEGGPDRQRYDVIVHASDGMILVELEPAASEEPDLYPTVRRAIDRLEGAPTLHAFAQRLCDEVRALTGLDRVMMYRFHEDHHGEVYAESRRVDLAPLLGLHYPADDIPAPAREIFKRIWVRPVPDARGALSELVPLANPVTGRPLDMTHCVLRGASVMYTEYLQNMGVAASLTLSLRRGEALWGLVAGHHLTPIALPWARRVACEFLTQAASMLFRAAEEREHRAYRERIDRVHETLVIAASREHELAALVVGAPNLSDAIDCEGVAMLHAGRWWRAGVAPAETELDALAAWLFDRPELSASHQPVFATDHLAAHYPEGASLVASASGVLAVPLSRRSRSLIAWFRGETLATISWAGRPDDKPVVAGPHGPRLTPRRSFELFCESVAQHSRPWLPTERDAASRLRALAMEIVVGRAGELETLNADLARTNDELDTFAYVASHDLKEPLRGIYKYADQVRDALEPTAELQRNRLDSLLRLASRMDGLLDSLLAYSRVGRAALDVEPVDTAAVLAEALEMVAPRIADRPTKIVVPRALPRVRCDHIRLREILSNLLSNALKYNDRSERVIEVGYLAPHENERRARMPSAAGGQVALYVADNGIGIAPHHHDQVFRLFRRLHRPHDWGGGSGAGLTIVAKLVERHGGSIWLDSALGEGTTVYFSLGASS